MALSNAKEMIKKAHKQGYAVPQFNVNNLEWGKTILETCENQKSPVILGISAGAAKYMGGFKVARDMLAALIEELDIKVPVAIHVDHGNDDQCTLGLKAGFTSLMFDGSSLPFEENIKLSQKWVKLAKENNLSLECEVGAIGGEEDGVVGDEGELANPTECQKMANLGIDFLAAGIGNIHGPYPENWKSINFDRLEEISKITNNLMPIVLHGGSGIPNNQIIKAIKLGVAKINVNTELQLVYTKGLTEYFGQKLQQKKKGYDPRKIHSFGMIEVKKEIINKISTFGSNGKG